MKTWFDLFRCKNTLIMDKIIDDEIILATI